jgi:hypothetical protein
MVITSLLTNLRRINYIFNYKVELCEFRGLIAQIGPLQIGDLLLQVWV